MLVAEEKIEAAGAARISEDASVRASRQTRHVRLLLLVETYLHQGCREVSTASVDRFSAAVQRPGH